MGQCEGDLSGGDCGECVKEALQQAEEVCGRAVSGQIYLFRCYISYKYYPNGVSGDESSGEFLWIFLGFQSHSQLRLMDLCLG